MMLNLILTGRCDYCFGLFDTKKEDYPIPQLQK